MDQTGAADTAAINAALADVGAGGSVLLGPGDWAAGSFTIQSTSGTDASTVTWMIM
jgi:hypothetical protein